MVDLSPLSGLRITTPRLELRFPTLDELVELANVARAGVHPPDTMPFRVAWTDASGEPDFVERFVAFHDEQRATWRPERWHLLLEVWAEGEPAGCQGIDAADFAHRRTAETGSWLGSRFQRRGCGTEMRAAALDLLFAHLGAVRATSGVIEGNAASARVSEKLGYETVGEGVVSPRGEPLREIHFALTRDRWAERRQLDVDVHGLEPCLPLFGLSSVVQPE